MTRDLHGWRIAAIIALVIGAMVATLAVGSNPPAMAGARSQATTTGPLAVLAGMLPTSHSSAGRQYIVALVDGTGRIVAHTTASVASQLSTGTPGTMGGALTTPLPPVSISSSRVYYLDGNAVVRSITSAGSTAMVTRLPGSDTTHVTFAVSPDDQHIAVGVISYTVFTRNGVVTANEAVPTLTRIYTQNLRGGTPTTLFTLSSTLSAEWPVAWVNGHMVVAVAAPGTQYLPPNPYNAFNGYHVASATTGARLAALCTGDATPSPVAIGPLLPTGTLCLRKNTWFLDTWDGRAHALSGLVATPYGVAALTPDGSTMAWAASGKIVIQRVGGRQTTIGVNAAPEGWIDGTHLVVAITAGDTSTAAVLDVRTGMLHRINLAATPLTMYGTLPSAL